MFTIEQIKEAHSKVKSGADFPKYFQDLTQLGVTCYHTYVADGHTVYFGKGEAQIQSNPLYETMEVAPVSDAEKFRHYLKIHQQGQTDFPTFSRHAAETGVEKWIVDMTAKTCTYYDKSGTTMLEEGIPS